MAEKYQPFSPFNYSLNDPIALKDPDGKSAAQCCTSYDVETERLIRDYTKGRITKEEYFERHKQIGKQGLRGAALISPVDEVVIVGGLTAKAFQTFKFLKPIGRFFSRVGKVFRNIGRRLTGKPTSKQVVNSGSKSTRTANKLEPDPVANGNHSTFKRDDNGDVYKYETWKENPQRPAKEGHKKGFDSEKRFDGGKKDGSPGAPHRDRKTGKEVPTPHMNRKGGDVEPPLPGEIPNNNRFNKNQ